MNRMAKYALVGAFLGFMDNGCSGYDHIHRTFPEDHLMGDIVSYSALGALAGYMKNRSERKAKIQ